MNLQNALQETGCAIFINGDCITSVERLTDDEYLLMTRRGVCILQCLHRSLEAIMKRYPQQQWMIARVLIFVE